MPFLRLPAIDGITAEHYKNSPTELLSIIVHILNTIVEQLDIPQLLKSGILTPVLKKTSVLNDLLSVLPTYEEGPSLS
jgi:hypothetical protein